MLLGLATYIPKFQPFYKHPVPGFIVTGLTTLAFLSWMVYVWATNFGPLAPSKRAKKTESDTPPKEEGRDQI
jgi:hypothetical protein